MTEYFNYIFQYLLISFNLVLFMFYTFILHYVYNLNKNNMFMVGLYCGLICIIHNFIDFKLFLILSSIILFIVFYLEQKFEFYCLIDCLETHLNKYEKSAKIYNDKIIPYVHYFFMTLEPIHNYMEKKIKNKLFSGYFSSVTKNIFDGKPTNVSIKNIQPHKLDSANELIKSLNVNDINNDINDLMKSLTNTYQMKSYQLKLSNNINDELFDDYLVDSSDEEESTTEPNESTSEPNKSTTEPNESITKIINESNN